MASKYNELVRTVLDNIGGVENINTVVHCQTRLRFTLVDSTLPNKEAIKDTDGVMTVLESGGQFQVVIGMHVKDVYEELEEQMEVREVKEEKVQAEEKEEVKKKNMFEQFAAFVSEVFNPVVPAISGAGMLKALLATLTFLNVLSTESQTYQLINMMSDVVFYFLPMLLAYTAARKFKTSPLIAIVLAGILLHPTYVTLFGLGEPVALFGLPVRMFNYASSVVPILLIVWAQSYIERFFNRIIPQSVNLIFAPMLIILVTGSIGLLVLGPIGGYVGDVIVQIFTWLQSSASWVVPTLIGGLLPLMVMFGIHHSVAPIGTVQMASTGQEGIFGPGALVSNLALGTASLVVGLRAKDKNTRQLAVANGITGLMGVTEPALFGTALPKRYPLIAALIGGGAGGFYAGITQTVRFGVGSSGLPAITLYIGEDTGNVINIIMAVLISMGVSAVLTFILGNHYEKEVEV